MSANLRRDIFRGMYNPVYPNPYTEKDDIPKPKHSPTSNMASLFGFRMPRRHNIIAFLNICLLLMFIYHIPQLPSNGIFPHSVILIPTPSKPQKSLFATDPAISYLSPAELQAHLLSLAHNLSTTPFPRHIYQTWKTISLPNDDAYSHRKTWQAMNPTHEYDLLTDKSALQYVLSNFNATDPFIAHLYQYFPQRILAADLLRYLIAFKSGGLYSDIDTECKQPIDQWLQKSLDHHRLPNVKASDINIIVGMELDILDKTRWTDKWVQESGFSERIQFLQWSIYAKPNHEILRRMISSISESVSQDIETLAPDGSIRSIHYDERQILNRTGPFRWTKTIMEYVDQIEGRKVGLEEYSGIKTARKFGDVLFLAVNKMSPGVPHSDAGGDETSFLIHHFGGTWRGDL
ncbi:hypothetical protein ABW20_dc0106642 [Dactylellina cionopaga]|nr:hypothetical protein ABW20_dc0106642 [Dactylellina cionopaga]